MLKKIFSILFVVLITTNLYANTPRSTGKYKNWESFSFNSDKGKICFAQTLPTKRSPGSIKRSGSRIFVTFRPQEEVSDEISVTSGHDYKTSSVVAKSGKKEFTFFF